MSFVIRAPPPPPPIAFFILGIYILSQKKIKE